MLDEFDLTVFSLAARPQACKGQPYYRLAAGHQRERPIEVVDASLASWMQIRSYLEWTPYCSRAYGF